MANSKTLKPFKKGHKKLGGRKKGILNKKSQSLDHLIMAAIQKAGSDGKGKDGAVGFFMTYLKDNPKLALRLLASVLRFEEKHPPKDLAQRELTRILQSAELNQDEKQTLARIWEKATGTRVPGWWT
jgi:hypothetical protein